MASETTEEVQNIFLLEPTEWEMQSFLRGETEEDGPIKVESKNFTDEEQKFDPHNAVTDILDTNYVAKNEIEKHEMKDLEMKEEKSVPQFDMSGMKMHMNIAEENIIIENSTIEEFNKIEEKQSSPQILEASTGSQSHALPTILMLQSKQVLKKGCSAHVHNPDDNNDDRSSLFCHHCKHVLVNSVEFIQHMKEHRFEENSHLRNFDEQSVRFEEGIFICAECGKKFVSKTTLIRHIKFHVTQNIEENPGLKNANEQIVYFEENIFICAECGKKFVSKTTLIKHMKIHVSPNIEENLDLRKANEQIVCFEENIFICAECGKKFVSKTTLIRHIKIHVSQKIEENPDLRNANEQIVCFEENIFICAECGKKFVSKTTLIRHIKIHVLKSEVVKEKNGQNGIIDPFSCADCSEIFRLKADLLRHMRKHQTYPDISKKVCSKEKFRNGGLRFIFASPYDETSQSKFKNKIMNDYRLTSETIVKSLFSCAHCEANFKFKTDLIMHLRSHMNLNYSPWVLSKICPICGRIMRSRNLRQHVASHLGETFFLCNQCSFSCITKNELYRHNLSHHCENVQFQCKICRETFCTSLQFFQHKSKLHSSQSSRPTRKEFSEKPKCIHCDGLFETKDDLDSHIKLTHRLKCNICSKILSSHKHLRRHFLAVHCSVKNHSCDHCGSKFASKGLVRKHIIGHLKSKYQIKKKCKLCGVFILPTSILSHNQTHHREKSFVCEECGAVFARSDYLRKHMFIHTKERPHLCSYCGVRFSRKDNLKSHERKHATLGDLLKLKPAVWKRPL